LNNFAAPQQVQRDQDLDNERMREERRKMMTNQMIEQQRLDKDHVRLQYRGVLQDQMQQHEMSRLNTYNERISNQNQQLQK